MNKEELTEKLEKIVTKSGLIELFPKQEIRPVPTENPSHVKWMTSGNVYPIKSFELWDKKSGLVFKIFHSPKMDERIISELQQISDEKSDSTIDFRSGDLQEIATKIYEILSNPDLLKIAHDNPIRARISKFEGLALPNIDL